MPRIRLKYPPPEEDKEFELLCLALLKEYWECPTLELYARRGEKQFGVDILDLGGTSPLRAAQCKLHEQWKSLSPSEIKEEVGKVKAFDPKIDHYAIATTAKVSKEAQNTVREINREHKKIGLFTVELLAWDKIKRLLDKHSNVAEQFYPLRDPDLSATSLREIKSAIQISTESIIAEKTGEGIHAEIDQAKQFIEQHEYQVARLLLNRVRERSWDKLSARQKFRVLSNLAVTHMGQGELEKAAALFLEAQSCQPDDEAACANETLAYQILGETERAFDLAGNYRKLYPNSGRILAIWLQNAPSMPLESLEQEVPTHLKSNPEILVALTVRATNQGEHRKAEALVLKATTVRPEWSQPWLLLAKIVFKAELPQELGNYRELADRISGERLRFAEDCCNKAITRAETERFKPTKAEALIMRALVRDLLGQENDAWDDARRAYEEDPTNPLVLRQCAMISEERGRRDFAIDLLRKLVQIEKGNENSYLLALALRHRAGSGDAEEAIRIFRRIACEVQPQAIGLRENVIQHVIDLLSKEERSGEIESFLQEVPDGSISEVATATLRGFAGRLGKDQQSAMKWAEVALSNLSESSSPHDRRRLARLFSSCGRHMEALPLWHDLAEATKLTDDTRHLIECALNLGKHDIVLTACRKLRQAGVGDGRLLDLELSLLEKYDVEAAIKLLQAHLTDHSDDRPRRLSLSVLGLRLNRKELVPRDPRMLPTPDEILPENWPALITVIREGGHINEALLCAYDLLRKHFGDVNAHRAFFLALGPMGLRPDVPEFATVGPGAAVCYVEEATTQERWVILEDLPDPDPGRNELSSTSPIAQNLIGKKKGDRFLVASATAGNRYGVVKGILSKFVYRYQDCLNEWQVRFPEVPVIEIMRVQKQNLAPGNEEIDISSILSLIDRREKQQEEIDQLYQSRPVPIHIIGVPFNRNSFQSVCCLATAPRLSINCCPSSLSEHREAIENLGTCSAVVIDLTAIGTLYLLDRVILLRSWPVPVVVSQTTMTELIQLATEEAEPRAEGGVFAKVDGAYALIEDTQAARALRAQRLNSLVDLVSSSSKVLGCQELAAVDPQKRGVLIEAFGNCGAESMVLASKPGHVLWTDDFTMARFAHQEFGVRNVWT
ncbi:MAG: GreA/GreB family elongation factor [Terriglobia bacterium]|jgi:tetratricopeptide (TPR) repeat protein